MSKEAAYKILLVSIQTGIKLQTMQKVFLCTTHPNAYWRLREYSTNAVYQDVKSSMLQEFATFSPGVLEIIRLNKQLD